MIGRTLSHYTVLEKIGEVAWGGLPRPPIFLGDWMEKGGIFYRRCSQWFSTRVSLQPALSWERPGLTFETDFLDTPGRSYNVSPDGQRLLIVRKARKSTRTKIHVVQNWFEELNNLVPTN